MVFYNNRNLRKPEPNTYCPNIIGTTAHLGPEPTLTTKRV